MTKLKWHESMLNPNHPLHSDQSGGKDWDLTPTFQERAQPVEDAIEKGTFDPVGKNWTDFKRKRND